MSKENEVRNAISDIYTQLRIIEDSLKDLYKRVMELEKAKPAENEVRNAIFDISDTSIRLTTLEGKSILLSQRIMELEQNVKPKEPEWWENIPEHGILVKSNLYGGYALFQTEPIEPQCFTPLTNEEIERFKR